MSNIHCEGAVVGIIAAQGNGFNCINISNVTAEQMMDPVRGAVYFGDGRSGASLQII